MEGITVTIGPSRVGRKDLVTRNNRVPIFIVLGLAIVVFDSLGAGGAFIIHAFAPDGDAGAHEGVFTLAGPVVDTLLLKTEVVEPAFSVIVSGRFTVFRCHCAAGLSCLNVLTTAEAGVVLLVGFDGETHRFQRCLECKWKRIVEDWREFLIEAIN